MDFNQTVGGILFADMIRAGAASLHSRAQEINDLNVFPIPDGDTGSNMLLTVRGGAEADIANNNYLSAVARRAADGMLLGARGNSGVILSQLFDGIAEGFSGIAEADVPAFKNAFSLGVKAAYRAVMVPTEGTILTVARVAAEETAPLPFSTPAEYLAAYIKAARRTLDKTPDMLPVLKRAGVVDSGGAGLICILEGMYAALCGEAIAYDLPAVTAGSHEAPDLDRFTEDSVLEFGYCTEVLLRLMRAKVDPEGFDVSVISDYLSTIGDSVVAVKTGSVVKLHVHTMTPDRVLAFCQQYGEFLTIKIENMSLQHNNTVEEPAAPAGERKRFGVVAVCAGEGVKQMFLDRGADIIVDGGQSMNPCTEDFLRAFRAVNAETIVVLPNNGNVILSARQAAAHYEGAEVKVLESHTIGDGYAALSMMNPDAASTEELMDELTSAMEGVVTAEISHCIRDAELQGMQLHVGDYIGVRGKDFVATHPDRLSATLSTVDALGFADYDILLVIKGKDAPAAEAAELEARVMERYPLKEVYIIDGEQDIFDYILIIQ